MGGASQGRVLVVGTTPDYVEMISGRFPGRALFLTDGDLRRNAFEMPPAAVDEVTADLQNEREALSNLERHLDTHNLSLSGITCFDDESLGLAASLAGRFSLQYHSEAAVRTSRSKFHSKRAWLGAGVSCPRALLCREAEEFEAVMDRLGFPLVLKPLTGSGSELVFWCRKREDGRRAFRTITRILSEHPDERMYRPGPHQGQGVDARQDIVAEEGLSGPEFSCDFLLENGRAKIVRVAGKLLAPELGTGTALLYYVPAHGDTGIGQRELENQLAAAAEALEFTNGLFMADFIVHRGRAFFLEVSPRPAGDCLPWLIRASSGMDILGMALDVAEGRAPVLTGPGSFRYLAALRVYAPRPGIVSKLDAPGLADDPRVVEVAWYRRPGHKVSLPPQDYFSRILGHVIFQPGDPGSLTEEASAIVQRLTVEFRS